MQDDHHVDHQLHARKQTWLSLSSCLLTIFCSAAGEHNQCHKDVQLQAIKAAERHVESYVAAQQQVQAAWNPVLFVRTQAAHVVALVMPTGKQLV
jgi:hypothetical protein